MKRFLFLLLLLLPQMIWAEGVSKEKAERVALQFWGGETRSAGVELVWTGAESSTRQGDEVPYYVFRRVGQRGFVIVAGDDRAVPILGYSSESDFDVERMPSHVRAWMEGLGREIRYVCLRGGVPSADVRREWQSTRIGQDVVLKETAQWDQLEPYNTLCPKIGDEFCATGCVVTAACIVMRDRQYPDRGEGQIEAYTTKTQSLDVPEIKLDHDYRWEEMPLNYKKGVYTKAQALAVAQLMRDVGAMMQVDFGWVTGGFAKDISRTMPQFMKYSTSMRCLVRDVYTLSEWTEMIKEEIRQNGPMVYTGNSDQGGGHAFVLDGYTDDDFMHVNWGWSGEWNGYYRLSALDPNGEQGTGGSGQGYNSHHQAIFGMVKRSAEEPVIHDLRFLNFESSFEGQSLKGITLLNAIDRIEVGRVMNFSFGMVSNFGTHQFTGQLSLRLMDAQGNTKKVLAEYDLNNLGLYPDDWFTGSCDYVPEELPSEGDVIRLYYQPKGVSKWTWLKGDSDRGCVNEFPLTGPRWEGIDLEASTQLSFSKADRMMVLTVAEGVAVKLENQAHQDISQELNRVGQSVRIDTKRLARGTYFVWLSNDKSSKLFKFVIGDKK